jgi:Mg/Co/Ni transporter MgtE
MVLGKHMSVSERKRDPRSGEMMDGGAGGVVVWQEGGAEDPAAGLMVSPPSNDSGVETVGSVASHVVVKVPSWFTVGAALRVARLKGTQHLLVLDRQKVVGSVGVAVLAAASPHQPVERVMTRSAVVVRPETLVDEAWRLMACHGLHCLPVASGVVLLGVVTRDDLLTAARDQASGT